MVRKVCYDLSSVGGGRGKFSSGVRRATAIGQCKGEMGAAMTHLVGTDAVAKSSFHAFTIDCAHDEIWKARFERDEETQDAYSQWVICESNCMYQLRSSNRGAATP